MRNEFQDLNGKKKMSESELLEVLQEMWHQHLEEVTLANAKHKSMIEKDAQDIIENMKFDDIMENFYSYLSAHLLLTVIDIKRHNSADPDHEFYKTECDIIVEMLENHPNFTNEDITMVKLKWG